MKEALFYKKMPKKVTKCVLCPKQCISEPGKYGYCQARKNVNGKLYSMVYGMVAAFNVDPIEKKPFFHFAPGSPAVSYSTTGCNLRCAFCQNAPISLSKTPLGTKMDPEDIVEFAVTENIPGIAHTYTEPTVYYEFALDIMKLASREGLYNVWVSNGYTNPEPIRRMAKYLDAVNVDLKGDIKFYRKLCKVPDEAPMHRALKEYKKHGVWIEITNLLIPGYNDGAGQVRGLAGWVKENLGVNTPIHFSRFYPMHKLTSVRPTPVETMEKAHSIASRMGMKWVYIGNVPGHRHESTYCPKCGELMVRRVGFNLSSYTEKCKCGGKLRLAGRRWKGIVDVEKMEEKL
jgi:pyruvate formate lyase activating enzyme